VSESPTDSLFSWLDAASNLNTLDVDVVRATADKRQAKLTDHVVETGAVVTDHIVIQPEELTLELVVTQTPMGGAGFSSVRSTIDVAGRKLDSATVDITVRKSQFQPGGFLLLTSGVRAAVGALFGGEELPSKFNGSITRETSSTVQFTAIQATAPVDRVNDAHETLIDIMNTGLLVTVSFKGRLYVDYLLKEVELTQGPGESGMGRFRVMARAFRTVQATQVSLPDPADFRALPKVQKGNKPATTPDPDPNKKGKTFMKRGAGQIDAALDKLGKLFGLDI
jgi:hypothetical protein